MEADALYHVKQLFYQGSYKACIAEASQQSLAPSDREALRRTLYVAHSHIALFPPQTKEARAILQPYLASEPVSPAIRIISAAVEYVGTSSDDEKAAKVDEARDLVIECEGGEGLEEGDEAIVRATAGTIFLLANEVEEAVATLTEGAAKDDLECMAVLIQLCLLQDRKDLAQATYNSAKKIGNDSMLVQAMEAWVGMKTGSRPLHQAYYFYEELYQLPNGRTPSVLASHAAAHLLLGHVDEAKADIQEAAQAGGDSHPNVLAVGASLGLEGYADQLAAAAPQHPLALDLAEKSKAFDEAAAKFAVAA